MMYPSHHTFGPTCHLAPSADLSTADSEDSIPHLNVQFFYSCPLSIDDPLSAVPSDSKSAKHPPRPFSSYDNKALEEAWQGLVPKSWKKSLNQGKQGPRGTSFEKPKDPKKVNSQKNDADSSNIGRTAKDTKTQYSEASSPISPDASQSNSKSSELLSEESTLNSDRNNSRTSRNSTKSKVSSRSIHVSQEEQEDHEFSEADATKFPDTISSPPCCEGMQDDNNVTEPENCIACQEAGPSKSSVRESIEMMDDFCPVCVGEAQGDSTDERLLEPVLTDLESSSIRPKVSTKFLRSHAPEKAGLKDQNSASPVPSSDLIQDFNPPQEDSGTTGLPFLKLASRPNSPHSQVSDEATSHERETTEMETVTMPVHTCKAQKKTKKQVEVPVGISRLHLVKLPDLLMQPIYWSPLNDIAIVTRATWFYKDTMYPVEPAVANQLERGYRELRPWSQTWKDELNSAVEVGASGEEKIAHRLWPKVEQPKGKPQKKPSCTLSCGPKCAAYCFHGEAAAEGILNPEVPESSPETKIITKKYANAQIIYEDSKKAYILKPNLQPSAYFGRKPLQKIRKGICVGIPIIRGFDWQAFAKLHPSKNILTKPESTAPVSGDANAMKGEFCPACRENEKQQNVSDLVLVVHGIGQKLSERVESFHFTLAINDLRRAINVECSSANSTRLHFREGFQTLVLPINWRANVSFEKHENEQKLDYSLSDVTQESLPAVRKMISDVMLDIPYYMSHHKPKMIQAVIQEANRVYRLWCKNNPGFEKDGRVHIIAHSLGSAMALEILSKQPTSVPKLNLSSKRINTKSFDFKTTNLFFVGSPAGFFLLLDQSKLLPRRGQGKPDAELGDDTDKSITGEPGMYGCLAVDNIYNVMHFNDPIAYRLNPCVDKLYATQLKEAQVPSASTSFFEGVGMAVRGIIPGVSSSSEVPIGQVAKPVGVVRLPSQLEMEVHDFTREEIAEKKFYLLNDNGQVDWYLNSDGGPLNFKYLNMLSAHSSYWLSADFIRFVVLEIGRKPGKNHTLPSMKANKKARK